MRSFRLVPASVPSALCASAQKRWQPRQQAVPLPTDRVPLSLLASCRGSRPQPAKSVSVQPAARRGLSRPAARLSQAECNSDSRHVEVTHCGDKVPEAQPAGTSGSATSKACAAGGPQQSSSRPGELRRAFLAALALSRFPHRPVIIDLFGGSGGVARAVQRLGFAALLVTLEAGPHCDILDDGTYHTLRGWISSNQVSGLFSATPCEGLLYHSTLC